MLNGNFFRAERFLSPTDSQEMTKGSSSSRRKYQTEICIHTVENWKWNDLEFYCMTEKLYLMGKYTRFFMLHKLFL